MGVRFAARARTACVVMVSLLAVGGCSSGGGDERPTATSSATAASKAVAAVASASPGSPAPALPVLASRTGNGSSGPLQVDINAVVVEPRFTRVTFTLWNKAGTGGAGWHVFELLNDGVYQMDSGPNTTSQDAWTVDGVYLVDTADAKRYLPARTAAGACVCSNNLSDLVEPQKGVALWSLFQALPAGVDTIDISVPKVGLFEKVPVSR